MEEEIFESEETRNALGYGYPEPEEKNTPISFLKEISRKALNTTTANLQSDELGFAKIPVRTNMEIANYCQFMDDTALADFFMDEAQILMATSLSREGFLPKLAVTTQKFSETSLKKQLGQQKKKGLFDKNQPEQQPY